MDCTATEVVKPILRCPPWGVVEVNVGCNYNTNSYQILMQVLLLEGYSKYLSNEIAHIAIHLELGYQQDKEYCKTLRSGYTNKCFWSHDSVSVLPDSPLKPLQNACCFMSFE